MLYVFITRTLKHTNRYYDILADPAKRVAIYVKELNEVLTKYRKGYYD